MTADLDTLLTALYVELTDRIIPFRGPCSATTTSGTGCAPPRGSSGTCSRGCWPRASTTPGCGSSRR